MQAWEGARRERPAGHDVPPASPETGLGAHWLRCGGHCATSRMRLHAPVRPFPSCRSRPPLHGRAGVRAGEPPCTSHVPASRPALALAAGLRASALPCAVSPQSPTTRQRPRQRGGHRHPHRDHRRRRAGSGRGDRPRRRSSAASARSLPELLRGRAGISIVNQGGLGKLSTLFLRGTESDHTLFLIDGVRVGSATSGLASLQDLPLAQIERIEIVRGPRSALYGADAIGGVIQVFTRRAAAARACAAARASAPAAMACAKPRRGLRLRGARGWRGHGRWRTSPPTASMPAVALRSRHLRRRRLLHRARHRTSTATATATTAPPCARTSRRATRGSSMRARCAPNGHNEYDGDYADNSDIVQQVRRRQRTLDAVARPSQLKLSARPQHRHLRQLHRRCLRQPLRHHPRQRQPAGRLHRWPPASC